MYIILSTESYMFRHQGGILRKCKCTCTCTC